MKTFIGIILILLIAGCSFNPATYSFLSNFVSNTSATNILMVTDTDPANYGNITDLDPATTTIEGVIFITFNKFLNSSDVNTTNIELLEEDGQRIDDPVLTYEKEFMRVKISAKFENNGSYAIKLVADNLKGENGDFLDGNGNGIDDGSPYDDVYLYFTTGSADYRDRTYPEIIDYEPKTGMIGIDDEFTIRFSEAMDSALVVRNITLLDENKNEVNKLEFVRMNWNQTQFTFFLDTLDYFKMYYIKIDCANIEDTNGLFLLPYGYVYEPNIPDTFVYYFKTEAENASDDDNPLHITGEANNFWLMPPYIEIMFDDSVDVSTINSNTVKVFYTDVNGNLHYIPGEISINPDQQGFKYSLINYDYSGINEIIIIDKSVMDNAGLYLDNNGNLIGGEDMDPYRKDYENSDNYRHTF